MQYSSRNKNNDVEETDDEGDLIEGSGDEFLFGDEDDEYEEEENIKEVNVKER